MFLIQFLLLVQLFLNFNITVAEEDKDQGSVGFRCIYVNKLLINQCFINL